jgi:hypothetical protein
MRFSIRYSRPDLAQYSPAEALSTCGRKKPIYYHSSGIYVSCKKLTVAAWRCTLKDALIGNIALRLSHRSLPD